MGPKTQSGGLKLGLFNVWYQVSTEINVKYPPSPLPMITHKNIKKKRLLCRLYKKQTTFFIKLYIFFFYLNLPSIDNLPEPFRKIANVTTPHIKGYS